MRPFNFEEAIGWNVLRASRQAIENAPNALTTDDVLVSVEIRAWTSSWPGTTDSGRSKSTIIGSASCAYRGPAPDPVTAEPTEDEERDDDFGYRDVGDLFDKPTEEAP
jgi:hypothetical protein